MACADSRASRDFGRFYKDRGWFVGLGARKVGVDRSRASLPGRLGLVVADRVRREDAGGWRRHAILARPDVVSVAGLACGTPPLLGRALGLRLPRGRREPDGRLLPAPLAALRSAFDRIRLHGKPRLAHALGGAGGLLLLPKIRSIGGRIGAGRAWVVVLRVLRDPRPSSMGIHDGLLDAVGLGTGLGSPSGTGGSAGTVSPGPGARHADLAGPFSAGILHPGGRRPSGGESPRALLATQPGVVGEGPGLCGGARGGDGTGGGAVGADAPPGGSGRDASGFRVPVRVCGEPAPPRELRRPGPVRAFAAVAASGLGPVPHVTRGVSRLRGSRPALAGVRGGPAGLDVVARRPGAGARGTGDAPPERRPVPTRLSGLVVAPRFLVLPGPGALAPGDEPGTLRAGGARLRRIADMAARRAALEAIHGVRADLDGPGRASRRGRGGGDGDPRVAVGRSPLRASGCRLALERNVVLLAAGPGGAQS